MKKLYLFVIAAVCVAAAPNAAKADMNWRGLYFGGNFGYGWGQASTAFPSDGDSAGTFGTGAGGFGEVSDGVFNHSLHREIYGLQAGYNVPIWRNLFGGVEATYNLANIMAQSENSIPDGFFFQGAKRIYMTRVNALMSIAPQVGYAWNRTFFRLKGGLAAGRVYSGLNDESVNVTFGQEQAHIGWTMGFGADYALTDHVFAGLSFDYYDLGTINYGGKSTPDQTFPLGYTVRPVLRTLSVRIAYKFLKL